MEPERLPELDGLACVVVPVMEVSAGGVRIFVE
jgi:hypothetical protein